MKHTQYTAHADKNLNEEPPTSQVSLSLIIIFWKHFSGMFHTLFADLVDYRNYDHANSNFKYILVVIGLVLHKEFFISLFWLENHLKMVLVDMPGLGPWKQRPLMKPAAHSMIYWALYHLTFRFLHQDGFLIDGFKIALESQFKSSL